MPGREPDTGSRRQRAVSFGSVAAGYAASRPDYPADAVTFLVGRHPRCVLDLGAGTGLLTGVLLAAGHEVVAVDPAEPVLAELRAVPAGAHARGGRGGRPAARRQRRRRRRRAGRALVRP